MKELERYLGATYSNSCQPAIKTYKPETSPIQEIPTKTPDTGFESPKADAEMNYLEKKNTDEAISQKLRKKDVHENDTHKIYNIFVDQTNNTL